MLTKRAFHRSRDSSSSAQKVPYVCCLVDQMLSDDKLVMHEDNINDKRLMLQKMINLGIYPRAIK